MLQNLTALGEKTFWTFVQVFLTGWLAADALNFDTGQAAAIAGAAAALTVVANGLPQVEINTGNAFFDVVGRIIRTGVVAALGYLVAAPVLDLSVDGWKTALMAAAPAVLAAIKGAIAAHVGDTDTAAILPASMDVGRNF